MKTKMCSKCKIEKNIKEFYKDSQKPDGFYPSCKKCKTINVKKYQNEKYIKFEKIIIMTSQENILNELQKGSILLKDLLEKFENKKELFTGLKELTDNRKIGSSETVGEGQTYYVK